MNISWGTKLIIVFALFASGIGYMVYRCVKIPVNLVAKEYYNDELAYQDVIDGTKNANALSSAVVLQKQGEQLIVQLPNEMKQGATIGTVFFYCPSEVAKDKKIALKTDTDAKQVISTNQIARGSYKVKITWQQNNKHYYNEQAFKI